MLAFWAIFCINRDHVGFNKVRECFLNVYDFFFPQNLILPIWFLWKWEQMPEAENSSSFVLTPAAEHLWDWDPQLLSHVEFHTGS